MDTVIRKEFIFKQAVEGTSKRSNKPYRMVELHDPKTLENTKFFLREDSKVNTSGLNFRDRVVATFSADTTFGRLEFVLESLEKVPEPVAVAAK